RLFGAGILGIGHLDPTAIQEFKRPVRTRNRDERSPARVRTDTDGSGPHRAAARRIGLTAKSKTSGRAECPVTSRVIFSRSVAARSISATTNSSRSKTGFAI